MNQEKASSNGSHQGQKRDDVAYVLDERRRAALADVDNAEFSYVFSMLFILCHLMSLTSWFHVKVCLVAGVGFFTDA
jgi:MFS transporter, PHS family, inorganic phosphate transporter